ncbi:hypothetical protein H0H87_005079 [Tephrocybe sp. NHM501043]|nr:hypothetical protein H0H87_005079 [Tephrocybe sp. NHM501043]
MHTKAATLTCLALIAASLAAPVSNRRTAKPNQGAIAEGSSAVCNQEAITFNLDSGKTENDCANISGATGFRATSATTECRLPVMGSGTKGICYGGALVNQRRSPEEVGGEPAAEDGEGAAKEEPATPAKIDALPCSEEGQSPVQVPKPSPTVTSSTLVPTITDKPGPPNAHGPHHPPPPTHHKGDNEYTWLGTAVFKMLGGLF